LKPLYHAFVSIVLSMVIFVFEGEPLFSLLTWFLVSIIIGVGVDVDHIFLAVIFNRKVAFKTFRSLNPLRLYRDFMNGRISKGSNNFDRLIIYSSFHLITMITVNLTISLYFPEFLLLSLVLTGSHYFMDHIGLFFGR
tara:strand:+ start:2255 stop:2668 length:414 start_codon:yes stop_codon:yes gene_type:complete